MNLAEWKQETRKRLQSLVENTQEISKSIPSVLYGALSVCTIMPLVVAASQGQSMGDLLSSLIGSMGANLLTEKLQEWHIRSEKDLAAELIKKATADDKWRAILDQLLEKLDSLKTVQTIASEADKDWFAQAIQQALQEVGSQLVVNGDFISGSVSNGSGVAVGKYITQIINYYTQPEYSIDETKLKEQIRKYLQWVRRRYGKMSLRSTKRQSISPLEMAVEQAYMPLMAEPFEPSAIQPEFSMHELFATSSNTQDTIGYRLVITGGPGAGKTTVLQYAACIFATALLDDNRELAEQKLNFTRDELPIPVLVPLSAYINFSKRQNIQERTLAAFITGYIIEQQQGFADLLPNFFDHLWRSGHYLILLLDGLDEIPSEEDRNLAREVVENLNESLHIVVTCRTASYVGPIVMGSNFQAINIKPLNEVQSKAIASHAYRVIYPQNIAEDVNQLNQLLDIIAKDIKVAKENNTKPLYDNPLMIGLLLLVYRNKKRSPRHRAELYMLATDNLLQPTYGLDIRNSSEQNHSTLSYDYEKQKYLVRLVAWLIHSIKEYSLEHSELREKLSENGQPTELISEFLELVRSRGTLLEESDEQYRFTHFVFQEFMVARYLSDEVLLGQTGFKSMIDLLSQANLVIDSWWHESVLLIAGYLAIDAKTTAKRFVKKVLAGISQNTETDLTIRLASSVLAIAACEEWFAQDVEYYRTIISYTTPLLLSDGNPQQRVAASRALGSIGDSRFGVNVDERLPTIYWSEPIAPGMFTMGRIGKPKEGPQFQCQLVDEAYCISRYPITVKQYQSFIEADGYNQDRYWTKAGCEWRKDARDRDDRPISGPAIFHESKQLSNYPQVGISWFEAVAYCNWLSDQLSYEVRLPTEFEWERAARYVDGRLYAWGNEFDPHKCNCLATGIETITSVGIFPEGNAVCGAFDMNGNVNEWCSTKWRDDYDNYETSVDDSLEYYAERVIRGGAFIDGVESVLCTSRKLASPDQQSRYIGFRIVTEQAELANS